MRSADRSNVHLVDRATKTTTGATRLARGDRGVVSRRESRHSTPRARLPTRGTSRSHALSTRARRRASRARMVDPSAPAAPERRKRVLVPLAGKSQLDANRRLFEWCSVNLVDDADDVFVFHFTRAKKTGVSALRAAATQRPGVRVINIDAGEDTERETEAEKKRHEEKRDAPRRTRSGSPATSATPSANAAPRAPPPSSPSSRSTSTRDSTPRRCVKRAVPTALRASGETTTTETRARGSDPSDEATRIAVPFASRERELAGRTLKPSDAPDAPISRSKRHAGNYLRGMRGCVRDASRRCAGGGAHPSTRPRVRRESRPKVSQTRRARFRVQRRARRRLPPCCVYRSLPSPSEDEIAARQKLGDEEQPQRVVCLALSGSDASHSAEWSAKAIASPVRSRRHPSLRRRQKNETTTSERRARVGGPPPRARRPFGAFMTAHPDPARRDAAVSPRGVSGPLVGRSRSTRRFSR